MKIADTHSLFIALIWMILFSSCSDENNTPDINGKDAGTYIVGNNFNGNQHDWTIALHNNANQSAIYSGSPVDARASLRGIGTAMTSTDPEWLSATPD